MTSKQRKLFGRRDETGTTQLSCLLLAQLGKSDLCSTKLDLANILEHCLASVQKIQNLIGGRILLVECERTRKLHDLYEGAGFTYLQDTPGEQNNLHQLYLPLKF